MTKQQSLTTRIRSVKSIQKTTRVMQMISASKFRAARRGLVYAREYCEKILDVSTKHCCGSLCNKGADGRLLVVFSSDRGLCGGFNYSIAKFLREYLDSSVLDSESRVDFLFIGKKAYDSVRGLVESRGKVLSIVAQPRSLSFDEFKRIFFKIAIEFTGYKSVSALYSRFKTINSQEHVVEEILRMKDPESVCESEERESVDEFVWRYEPNFEAVNRRLLINGFVGKLYLCLCESITCEHSGRMISMESANSNTQRMLKKLILDYNRSRQAAITGDLIEIVSGCEAAG